MKNNNNENPQKTMQFSKILIAILFLFIMFGAGLIIGKMASSNETNTIAHSQEDKKYNNAKNETSTTLNEYNNTEEENTNIAKEEPTNTNNESKEDSEKVENITKENTTSKKETTENKKTEPEKDNTFIKKSDYVKTWETDPNDSEIHLYEDGTFVKDNYTSSSEIKGTYTVDSNIITFTTENNEKWNGTFNLKSDKYVLNININGNKLSFYDLANTTSEETAPDVNTKTQLTSLKGKYKFTSETENNYHNATINILEQNDSTIKFEISAVNGKDIDHVNIGELEGTANKTGINQYVYEETIDGTTHKITFVFDAHKIFEWVTISESYYPDNNNPFAGHGVYFTGEYEKVEN